MVNSLSKRNTFHFHSSLYNHTTRTNLFDTHCQLLKGQKDKWRQMLTPHTYISAHCSQQKQTSRNHNPVRLDQLNWVRPDTLTGCFCDYVQRQWLDHGKPGLSDVNIWRISVYCEHLEYNVKKKKSSQIAKCVYKWI